MHRGLAALVAVAVVTTCADRCSADFITNGGFETGDFTGWTLVSDGFTGVDDVLPHSGTYAAYFGDFTSPGSISQNVALTVGQEYTLSFWLTADEFSDEGPNHFVATFGDQELLNLTDVDPFGYTLYSFNVTATSATTTIKFTALNSIGFFDLDDVSLLASTTNPVPGPASGVLLAIGLACTLPAIHRRRKLPGTSV